MLTSCEGNTNMTYKETQDHTKDLIEQDERTKTMQATMKDWAKEELATIANPASFGERLPTLKLEAGKIVQFKVDEAVPFGEYTDKEKGTVKAILCVTSKGTKYNLWLNKKNPLYRQILEKLAVGKAEMYVSTTGSQKETRYELVEFS